MLVSLNSFGDIDYVDGDALDIQGEYQNQPRNEADRLKAMRRKLEQRNEIMVKRKIESMRIKREIEMAKKLQQSFNQQLKALDTL